MKAAIRRFVVPVLVVGGALVAPLAAQNGSNYHVLHNGPDDTLLGVGAGGTQTKFDGIGTYIPGEDLRGSLLADPDGGGPLGVQFSYHSTGFEESVCIYGPGISGLTQIRFPGLYFYELDGLNPNQPAVFTQPVCTTPFTASFIPYGLGPGSSVSFVVGTASALGPIHKLLLPDNGLTAGTGTATLAASGGSAIIPIPTGCFTVHFNWVGTALRLADGIDGLWHWAVNSDDGNQYWQLSLDEMNLWQSNTVASTGGVTSVLAFSSVVDYCLLIQSREANTIAALAPHGIEQAGPYYHQTENMVGGGGPNGGFDIGRGSRAISLSGLGGVKVPPSLGGLGNGAQDPAYNPSGTVPTLGFVSFDNKPNQSTAGVGSLRVTWISVDLALIAGQSPSPGVTMVGGTVRLPVETAGFLQAVTRQLLPIFIHETKAATSGWPHPAGLPAGAFGVPAIAGGSVQLAVAFASSRVPCNIGIPIALQYGSTGKNPSNPAQLTFNPQLADISGRKELYLIP